MTAAAISEGAALAMGRRYGLPLGIARAALRQIAPAAHFDGAPYYFPDDVEAALDVALGGLEIDAIGGDV